MSVKFPVGVTPEKALELVGDMQSGNWCYCSSYDTDCSICELLEMYDIKGWRDFEDDDGKEKQ